MVDNVEFHNLYCLSDTGVLENSGKWVRNVEGMRVKVILKRFLIGKEEGKRLFRRPVWIWEDNIEIDIKELYQDGFGYSCFKRPLNDIPMNSVINCKFYKILGNILISQATIGISGCTVYWMCIVLWSLVYWFSVMCIFF